MSYYAEGEGSFVLRFDDQSVQNLKASMLAHYDTACQAYQNSANETALSKSDLQWYQTKKQRIEELTPQEWIEDELMDVGFSEIYFIEATEQQCLKIDTSFDGKYREDNIMELLDLWAPYTIEGSLPFCGEDDSHWQLRFDGTEWVEDRGEILYTAPSSDTSQQDRSPYPDLAEGTESYVALVSEIQARMQLDDRPAEQRGHLLLAAFRDHDPDGVLLALTGWALQSLGAFAGIWRNAEDTENKQ